MAKPYIEIITLETIVIICAIFLFFITKSIHKITIIANIGSIHMKYLKVYTYPNSGAVFVTSNIYKTNDSHNN